MWKFCLVLLGLLTGMMPLQAQVAVEADFNYLKRVFDQPAHWQELDFEQETLRFLEHQPCAEKSDSVRFFLGVYYFRSGNLAAADYFFSRIMFTTHDEKLRARTNRLLRKIPHHFYADSMKQYENDDCEKAFFAWLQLAVLKKEKNFKSFYSRDAGCFLRHFPDSPEARLVDSFLQSNKNK